MTSVSDNSSLSPPRWLRHGLLCAGLWLVSALTICAQPYQSELMPEVELHPQTVAEEVCRECLEPSPDGWSPLPARYHDDWNAHYAPLFSWIKHTPLCLATDDAPTGRHVGKGIPLQRASWLNRRYQTSAAIGAIWGADFSDGVTAESALLGVVRAGVDTSHFAGWEARFAFAAPNISDVAGTLPSDASSEIFLFDLNVMFYPWGDSQWRPYTSLGFGLAYYRYGVSATDDRLDTLFSIPLGVGLKYRQSANLAFRAELTDYLTFGGSELGFRNNLTLTAGLEWHFGGRRKTYWPWNPANQGY